jgi:ABC-2 type transport system ATP-binding protein
MTSTAPAVLTQGLTRTFDSKVAVNALDLRVERGEFFGFLGPNGAGKTTSIKMMIGVLRPTRGQVWVCGYDVQNQPVEVKRRIGVLPEDVNLYDRLSGREYLSFSARMYGVPGAEADRRTEELLKLMGLWDDQDKLILEYSHGMKKKIALAAAILHDPEVLFLDEPFSGIDAISGRVIRDVLRQMTQLQRTIIFSSHVLEVVEHLCTRVAIINQGNLAGVGDLAELRAKSHTEGSLEDIFLALVGAETDREGLSWLK